MHSFRPQKSTTSAAKVHSLDGEDWSSRCVANSEDLYYNARSGGGGGYTINEGATCLLAKGRQSTLAEHGDHLLRFSFIASIHVERPRASNDREKMEVPRYRAPRSVCLAEIAAGLDLSDVGPGWSVARKEKAANVGAVTVTSHTDVSAGGRRACICFHARAGMWSRNWSSWAGTTLRERHTSILAFRANYALLCGSLFEVDFL